ncbi:hypothetical protein D7Y23_25330 [Corallococcus sp. AB050B]|nr:hypothetical protein D7Y23_25330 [Corallococcus sp. AB050B]
MDHGVELLAAKGVTLGYPYSSQLKGTSLPLWMIPQAEKIWLRYLEEQAAGLHDDSEETEP